MTSQELSNLLNTVADALDALQNLLPTSVDDEILSVLNSLGGETLKAVAPIIQLANPQLTQEVISKDLATAIELVTTMKELISSGKLQKLARICRSISQRRVILAIVARIL